MILHKYRIVHGDIKAKNILVAENKTLFIADLGTCTRVDADGIAIKHRDGTPLYMAIEATQDYQRLSTAADIYAIGVTLFKLILFSRFHDRELIDLCLSMLTLNYMERPTAVQCLEHPFLNPQSFMDSPSFYNYVNMVHDGIVKITPFHELKPWGCYRAHSIMSSHQPIIVNIPDWRIWSNTCPEILGDFLAVPPSFPGVLEACAMPQLSWLPAPRDPFQDMRVYLQPPPGTSSSGGNNPLPPIVDEETVHVAGVNPPIVPVQGAGGGMAFTGGAGGSSQQAVSSSSAAPAPSGDTPGVGIPLPPPAIPIVIGASSLHANYEFDTIMMKIKAQASRSLEGTISRPSWLDIPSSPLNASLSARIIFKVASIFGWIISKGETAKGNNALVMDRSKKYLSTLATRQVNNVLQDIENHPEYAQLKQDEAINRLFALIAPYL
jgi:hypothetical protein